MATLSDMRNHIKSDLVIFGTDFDTQIDNAIRSTLRDLRQRKFWFLEESDTLTLASGDNSVALPSDFGTEDSFELISSGLRLTNGRGFDFLSFNDLRRKYWTTSPVDTGQPVACAVSGLLYTSHIADASYSIDVFYFKKDATLPEGNNDTSVWFDDGYDVVRSQAQFIFKRDSKHFAVTEEDGSMARMHLQNLGRRHEQYKAGL